MFYKTDVFITSNTYNFSRKKQRDEKYVCGGRKRESERDVELVSEWVSCGSRIGKEFESLGFMVLSYRLQKTFTVRNA